MSSGLAMSTAATVAARRRRRRRTRDAELVGFSCGLRGGAGRLALTEAAIDRVLVHREPLDVPPDELVFAATQEARERGHAGAAESLDAVQVVALHLPQGQQHGGWVGAVAVTEQVEAAGTVGRLGEPGVPAERIGSERDEVPRRPCQVADRGCRPGQIPVDEPDWLVGVEDRVGRLEVVVADDVAESTPGGGCATERPPAARTSQDNSAADSPHGRAPASSTMLRSPGHRANFVGFGRAARAHVARSTGSAGYLTRPPFAATSLESVDGARPGGDRAT